MARNRRQRSYPQPYTAEKNKILEFEKEKAARAKCRASITNTEMCQDCSQSAICSSEATTKWMEDKGEGEKEDNPSEAV